MDLTQLANLGEFIGGVAVLVTLIYLAFQVRQANRVIRAEAESGSIQSFAEANRDLLKEGSAEEITFRVATGVGYEELSERERFQALLARRAIVQRFEAAYHRSTMGHFGDEYWERMRRGMGEFLSPPVFRHLLNLDVDQYPRQFLSEMKGALADYEESGGLNTLRDSR